jgi:hypothetical protein
MNWINIKDKQPNVGQNIIAVGTWFGEMSGRGESEYMGIGEWKDEEYVSIDSDIYGTAIFDVTHWMPLPKYPNDN